MGIVPLKLLPLRYLRARGWREPERRDSGAEGSISGGAQISGADVHTSVLPMFQYSLCAHPLPPVASYSAFSAT